MIIQAIHIAKVQCKNQRSIQYPRWPKKTSNKWCNLMSTLHFKVQEERFKKDV